MRPSSHPPPTASTFRDAMGEEGGYFGSPYGIPHREHNVRPDRGPYEGRIFACQIRAVGNMRRGCILRRPCLRRDSLPFASAIFPARQIWHRIFPRVRNNDLLRPALFGWEDRGRGEIQYGGRGLRIRF